jgi:hypothetical protein
MICAAIDPGQSGGLAYINLDSGQVFTQKMPETTKDICLALSDFKRRNAFIILEAQHARPSGIIHRKNPQTGADEYAPMRGSAASWTFAQHYGELRGLLVALEIPFVEMKPKDWMKASGIRPKGKTEKQTQWKNFLKEKAQERFPGTKVTLAVADALLMCALCHRLYGHKRDPFSDI